MEKLKTYFMTKESVSSYSGYVQAYSEQEAKELFLEIPNWECEAEGTPEEITSISEKDWEEDFTDDYFPIFRDDPKDSKTFYTVR